MDLTRKELYSLIWEKPLKYIINTYGGTYQVLRIYLQNMIFRPLKMDIGQE